MPPKKSSAKPSNVKMEKDTVKQIVNVRVGDTAVKKRKRMKKPRALPARKPEGVSKYGEPKPDMMSALSAFSRPNISLSLQSPVVQQPSYLNEYNMLLRELANERKQRLAATPILSPNTTPLTANAQKTELLVKKEKLSPLDPITERFSNISEQTVNKELYDDPQTNENMLSSPPNLAYNLSQKLPIINYFDYEDVEDYDNENEAEQNALEEEVVEVKKPKKRILIEEVDDENETSIKKPTKKEQLIDETNRLIEFYNSETNDALPLVKKSLSNKKIKEQMNRVNSLIESRALKIKKTIV